MRWEFYPNVSEDNNLFVGLDLAKHAVVNGASVDMMVKAGAALPSIVKVYESIACLF